MSLYNDLLKQSEKAKFNAQQAGLSGDKRLEGMYNSTAEQLFIQAMNAKMQADEKEVEIQNYYTMQEQRRQTQNNSYRQSYAQYNESDILEWLSSLSDEEKSEFFDENGDIISWKARCGYSRHIVNTVCASKDDINYSNNSKMSTILETVGIICGILIGCLIIF